MSHKVGPKDARLKSKGCISCIGMKVKCDQTRPQCQRCQRGRRQCEYRDPNAVVFRQDPSAASMQKRNARSSPKTPDKEDTPSVPQPVSTDWVQCAVSHFFYNFVVPPKPGFPGIYESLPRLYTADTQTPCFRNAVNALALANYALVKQMGPEQLDASRDLYSLAMHQLRSALNSSEAASPSVLGTTLALWKYDIIMGQDFLNSRSAHRSGQIEVLRLRLADKNPNQEGWLDRSVLAFVQMQSIGTSKPPVQGFPAISDIWPNPDPIVSILPRLLPELASVGAAIPPLLQQPPNLEELTSYVQTLDHFELLLDTWEEQIPAHWKYTCMENPLLNETVLYPEKIILLPCINIVGIWITYWIARLSVLRSKALLHPLASLAGVLMPSQQAIRSSMLDIVNTICAAIPYMLGQVKFATGTVENDESVPAIGAFFSVRVLFICAQIPCLNPVQRYFILQCLSYVGNAKGIRQALLLREEVLGRS